jgi:O-antigen/teichoic acid export membrane protein
MTSLRKWLNTSWATIKAGLQLGDSRTGATLAQRFVHGSFWSLVGAVGAQGLTLVASMLTARLLGKESFGEFSFLQGTVATAATFVGFGLGLTATRYVAGFRQENPQRAASLIRFVMTFASVVSAAASAIMALGAPYLAVHLFHLASLSGSIRWAALYLFCVTVNGVQTGVLAGFESFRAVANVNITRGVATLLLTVPLVMLWHIEGAFAAMGLAGCLAYGMSVFQVAAATKAHGFPKSRTMDWGHAKVLWTFSLPAVLAGILVTPVTWVVSLWLSQQPNGYGELGLFGAANQWRIIVYFIPLTLCQPLVPLLTSLAVERNRTYNRILASSILLTTVLSAAVSAVVIIGMPVISRFYGKGYADLNRVLMPLMLAAVLATAYSTIAMALASQERMWTSAILNLFWACTLLLVSHYAIPLAGAQGLAYSFVSAQLVLLCTSLYCVFFKGTSSAIGRCGQRVAD